MGAKRNRVYFPSDGKIVHRHPKDIVVLTCEVINFVPASAYKHTS